MSKKRFTWLAYETKSGFELPIAVGETAKELGDQLKISANEVRNRAAKGSEVYDGSRCGYIICKVEDYDDENEIFSK